MVIFQVESLNYTVSYPKGKSIMALTKNVDGKEIECTPEEEALIRAEWAANEKEAAATEYSRKRQDEYPSFADQLESLWKAMDSGEIPKATIFYDGIARVRQKYPKP